MASLDEISIVEDFPRKITTLEELKSLNVLTMRERINVKETEYVFYTYQSENLNDNNYIYHVYIKSPFLKNHVFNVRGSLIKDYKYVEPTEKIDDFLSKEKSYIKIDENRYYKVCILDLKCYNSLKRLTNMKNVGDLKHVFDTVNYMMLDFHYFYNKLAKFLRELEANAIEKYWNKLCKKPTYQSFLNFRMFPSKENLDNNTKRVFNDIVNSKEKQPYVNDDYVNENEADIKNTFFDEIPIKNIQEDLDDIDDEHDDFASKYYDPPKNYIDVEDANTIFSCALIYCTMMREFTIIHRLYRAFAIVPELSHAIFSKRIQTVYILASRSQYLLGIIDSIDPKKPLPANAKAVCSRIDYMLTNMNMGDFEIDNNIKAHINTELLFASKVYYKRNVYDWNKYMQNWNRITAYAFYIMYVEECYYRMKTQDNSRYIFSSDDVKYWRYYSMYSSSSEIYEEFYNIKGKDLGSPVVPCYFPFTIGPSHSTSVILYTSPNKYKPIKKKRNSPYHSILEISEIKMRLIMASNNLLDESFPWSDCGLNLTGSMLVASVAYNVNDATYDDIYNPDYTKFMEYFNVLYKDADIDLYIETNDQADYNDKIKKFTDYLTTRYKYLKSYKLSETSLFSRYKFKQEIPLGITLKDEEKMKDIDVYRNYFGSLYKYHLPVVRMRYDGNDVKFYPSCISALMTGINGNYKWFKSTNSAIDIIIKYMRRGYAILLNNKEKKIIYQRLNYLIEKDREDNGNVVVYGTPYSQTSDKSLIHSIQNTNISHLYAKSYPSVSKNDQKNYYKAEINMYWKGCNGIIINPKAMLIDEII